MSDAVSLYLGDCLEVMRDMPDGCIDAMVTDPPYGIGYASARRTRLGGLPRKNQASFGKDVFDASWIVEAYRVLRNDSFAYCFTRWDVLADWKMAFDAVGFQICQRLIWDKCHWKMGDLRYYGSQVEDVLLFRKGSPEMFPGGNGRSGNIFRHSSAFLPEGQEDHPTQKPVYLICEYVNDGSARGATVLDPFMGSGTTGVARVRTGRRFVGIEINPIYYAIAERRIRGAQLQAPLIPHETLERPIQMELA